MTQEGNLRVPWSSGRQDLTLVHHNEDIPSRYKPGMGCMRWLVWAFILEAAFCAAMVLCWWLWRLLS